MPSAGPATQFMLRSDAFSHMTGADPLMYGPEFAWWVANGGRRSSVHVLLVHPPHHILSTVSLRAVVWISQEQTFGSVQPVCSAPY
jgi:hypothetical protein